MNTAVIDPIDGKIKALLSGCYEYHAKNIDGMVAIETPLEDLSAKKGELVDGVWQLVDDIDKLIKNTKKIKEKEIVDNAAIITDAGIQVDGEEFVDGKWQPCSVTIFYGKSGIEFVDKITKIQNSLPETVSWVLYGENRISTANCSSVIASWMTRLAEIAIAEDAKKMAVIEAQTIEDVQAISSEVIL